MTGSKRISPHNFSLRAFALVIVLSCAGVALVSCNAKADYLADAYLVNQSREQVGARPLGWSPALAAKAQAWAEHLAATGQLQHSSLTQGVPAGWQALGENVGVGGGIVDVHSAFLNSPEHRANMLNPTWRVMGLGAVRSGNNVWVVEEYQR
jgi:uncharacterized protein YkwD